MTANSDPHLALAYALRARQLVPEEPAVIDTVGWVYLKLNQVDQALALFREVVEKDPRRAAYRYHLAAALEQKGDHDAARKEAERASQSAPSKEEEQEINELLRKLRQ
jgi:tetratricopeptide (TPR) repeat protein